ncbi:MAG TPA: hypothetical protein VJ528_02265 [Geothrix sp.]|nr:hypothetical protein [Geothrix sp.]
MPVALWDAKGPAVAACWIPAADTFLAVQGMGATWNGKPKGMSRQAGLDCVKA